MPLDASLDEGSLLRDGKAPRREGNEIALLDESADELAKNGAVVRRRLQHAPDLTDLQRTVFVPFKDGENSVAVEGRIQKI